jgi:predicted RNase H-like nuclease
VRPVATGPVLGVDGCRGGWVGVVLTADDAVHGVFGADIAAVLAAAVVAAGPPAVVGVDMPLHLSAAGWRPCDQAVRAHLGAKRSSVFPVPPAPALALDDYAAACATCRALTGKAFSKQLWMLRPKILELETWWTSSAGLDVREVHPETSFSLMVGAPIAASKRTAEGVAARRAALAEQGIVVPDDIGPGGRLAATDDVVDAAAVAWTARRVAAGTARSFPDPPVTLDGEGAVRLQAVWA